jgi:hypothetical protein
MTETWHQGPDNNCVTMAPHPANISSMLLESAELVVSLFCIATTIDVHRLPFQPGSAFEVLSTCLSPAIDRPLVILLAVYSILWRVRNCPRHAFMPGADRWSLECSHPQTHGSECWQACWAADVILRATTCSCPYTLQRWRAWSHCLICQLQPARRSRSTKCLF